MKRIFRETLIYYVVGFAYILWAGFYIYKSSFIALDGNRYFSLLDDAMISMRYAWNLSHGLGLVWNAGERVEGYSNLLMTLMMSAMTWFFDKKSAVLAVQVLGIPTVLICAHCARSIFLETLEEKSHFRIFGDAVFLFTLLYYPLSYWTLLGMETGLTTLFVLLGALSSMRWLKSRSLRKLNLSAVYFGLAFLTRNDALIFPVVVFLFIAWTLWKEGNRNDLRSLISFSGILASFVLALLLFRWFYYGEYLPNTYVLKIGRIPLSIRVNDGLLYVFAFMKEAWFLIVLSVISLALIKESWKWFLAGFPLMAILYQISTGGDAWDRWRFIVPSIPFIMALIMGLLIEALRMIGSGQRNNPKRQTSLAIVLFFGISFMLLAFGILKPYWKEASFAGKIPDHDPNRRNMNVALAINAVTARDAKIGVFWAGLIPYYTDRYAIDFLGKSDKYIAGEYPHLPEEIVWFEQITLPGHNKYDLYYSIKELQPTYIQRYYFGDHNLRHWALQNYTRLEYRGRNGTITLILLKDSPLVYWEKGTIIPWEGQ